MIVFNSQPQDIKERETYFIIHPVLKNLTIKKQSGGNII